MNLLKVSIIALVAASFIGCAGNVVPPGKKVIILDAKGKSTLYENGVYYTYGRDKVYFVDGKLKSFTESMKILCADDINMDVDIKLILCFDVGIEQLEFIKTKVPTSKVTDGDIAGFELSLEKFYELGVKDIARGTARNVVSPNPTDDIRPNRKKLETEIATGIEERIKTLKYPLHVSAILLSNLDYPKSVKDMREDIKRVQLDETRKAAQAQAELAEAERRVAVELAKAKVKLVQAEARANENRVLSSSLTPEFLKWREIEMLETLAATVAEGPNNTVFVLPYDMMKKDGLVGSVMVRDAVEGLAVAPKK